MMLVLNLFFSTIVALDCLSLGFSESLSCSTCSEMDGFGLPAALITECEACCTEDREQHASQQFNSATLIVDERAYETMYSDLKAFFSVPRDNVKVKFRFGARPSVELTDSNDLLVKTLNVQKWSKRDLVEFFGQALP